MHKYGSKTEDDTETELTWQRLFMTSFNQKMTLSNNKKN